MPSQGEPGRRAVVMAILLLIGAAFAAAPVYAESNSTTSSTSTFQTSQLTNYTITDIGTAPSVRIVNSTLDVESGVPSSIVFNVTIFSQVEYIWAISAYNPELPLSFYQIQLGQVQLPSGVSVEYPKGDTFEGNQSALYAVVTVTGESASQGPAKLELTISPVTEGTGSGAVGETIPVTLTVGAAPPSAGQLSWTLFAEVVILWAGIVVAGLVVVRRRRKSAAVPAEEKWTLCAAQALGRDSQWTC